MQIEELNEVKEQVSNCFYVMVNIHTHTHDCPFLGGLRHVDVYFAPKKNANAPLRFDLHEAIHVVGLS